MRGRGIAFVAGQKSGKNKAANQQEQESKQADELEKLSKMHDKGQLSDEEFTQAKKKILNEDS